MKVFSFDIFDTVLTRNVLNPKDIFILMGERLSDAIPGLPERVIKKFWGARVWAEFVARRKSEHDDIGIADIYRTFCVLCRLNASFAADLQQLELNVEREILVPIDGAVNLVGRARENGPVVYISDMYLPIGFLSDLLDRFGLLKPEDRLYVSGELGLTKSSGKLFRYVLDDLGIKPHNLIHFGDNPHSDRKIPCGLGIKIHQPDFLGNGFSAFSFPGKDRCHYGLELVSARLRLGWRCDV